MTLHKCPDCNTRKTAVGFAKRDLRALAVKLNQRPDDETLKAALPYARQSLSDARENLEEHEAECRFVPESPTPIRGTMRQRRQNRAKPKPVVPTKVLARSELVAAMAEVDARTPVTPVRLPPVDVAWSCRECGKALPPGRSLCGKCSVS